MEEVKNLLKVREKELLQLKKEKKKALQNAPEGTLRICTRGNKVQYYHRTVPKDFNGVYIREKDYKLAQKLAQKDYDAKILKAVEKELHAIQKYNAYYPDKCAEQLYENLHKERQKLIFPVCESEDAFVQQWESIEYEGKVFYGDAAEFYTAKNERVRSKSEVIIADALNREGVPYRYEFPIYLEDFGTVYPDFTVLHIRTRKEILWEHLGMMDEPDYAEKAIQKIATYEQNGFFPGENLILTYETRKNPLNQKILVNLIRHYLQ